MTSLASAETPVMRQYLEAKEQHPDCILFFRLGDFYEMFYEDAVYASQALDLTLTARDKHRDPPIPMCGVPHHAAKQYIAKLLELGKKVALCEQLEDAKLTKKMVRRAVTQVITPGVRFEEDQLSEKSNNYLAALAPGYGDHQGWIGIAHIDASTGEFATTQVLESQAIEELCRIAPAELLWVDAPTEQLYPSLAALSARIYKQLPLPMSHVPAGSIHDNQQLLRTLLGASSVPDVALTAAAACVRYAKTLQSTGELPLQRLRVYEPSETLLIDETTRRHLELVQTNHDSKREGSLLSVLDRTQTAMGGRLLRRWLLTPTQHMATLCQRHDAVAWLVTNAHVRTQLQAVLAQVHDVERLTGRLALQVATPRDLARLGHSLQHLPELARLFQRAEEADSGKPCPVWLLPGDDLGTDVAQAFQKAFTENPPTSWKEGGIFQRGYQAELDEWIDLASGGKQQLLAMEERERVRTGISSLKIQYNRVFGYYLEVTRVHLNKVPADYIRKQTLAQAERFSTPELSEYEARILGAEDRRLQLEEQLFVSLRQQWSSAAKRLFVLAEYVGTLDVLCSLADVAHHQGYVRPELTEEPVLAIEEGRHPVLEHLLPAGTFVPNDVHLDPSKEQMWLITGPNMAGKSTVMRQVALICILAQMGSFVPARKAKVGLLDRVFARIGAADNLIAGDSTFMVEMRETASILQQSSRRSLVLLDEIGRGTSTYDGISIAWAVAEYVHDAIGCKTLFATHYHELCALAHTHPRVHNVSVAVRQVGTEVVFLHKLVPGAANRSYGIEVARLAGLPPRVLERAREILSALESGTPDAQLPTHGRLPGQVPQLSLFQLATAPSQGNKKQIPVEETGRWTQTEQHVLDQLGHMDCDQLTPRQALHTLAELSEKIRQVSLTASNPRTEV